MHVLGTVIVVGIVAWELYYWIVYFPKAWRTPGMNREIDDMRLVTEHVNLWTGEPKRAKKK